MKSDQSYGIVPLRVLHANWEVLLIQHHAGHWSFPKGHPEAGELPLQTAERELREETGLLIIRLLAEEPLTEKYSFTHRGLKIDKTVHYFPALVNGKVIIQQKEIKDSQWLSLPKAQHRMTFMEGKKLCKQIEELLGSKEKPV